MAAGGEVVVAGDLLGCIGAPDVNDGLRSGFDLSLALSRPGGAVSGCVGPSAQIEIDEFLAS